MRYGALVGCILTFLLVLVSAASATVTTTDVTTCGQVIERGVANLVADLDCSTFPGVALTLKRGILNMNGHTITGNPTNADPSIPGYAFSLVRCHPRPARRRVRAWPTPVP